MRLPRLVLFCLLPAFASAQGIAFQEGSWQQALQQAQNKGQLIFLDAYTSWCGPCKAMSARVFPDSSVGAYFNPRFLSVKMDMEKGEGVQLAQQYKVNLYPTLLFLDAQGNVVHRIVGYHNPQELLAEAAKAADPQNNLAALEARYQRGDRSKSLLKALLYARAAAYDPGASRLASEYLKEESDWSVAENTDIIFRFVEDPFADAFAYLIKKRPAFNERYGQEEVQSRIDGVFENYLQNNPALQLGQVQHLYATVYPEQGERLASAYRMSYYQQRSDMENFARAAVDHYQKYPATDAEELNELAWLFYQNVQEKSLLEQALQWSKQACKLQANHYNYETLARLNAKLGNKKAAQKAAQKSIALARAAGEDSSGMEAFLKGG